LPAVPPFALNVLPLWPAEADDWATANAMRAAAIPVISFLVVMVFLLFAVAWHGSFLPSVGRRSACKRL